MSENSYNYKYDPDKKYKYDPDAKFGSENTKAKKKDTSGEDGWWFDRYDYDYRDYSYSPGSGSRSWKNKLGYGDYNYSYGYSRPVEEQFQDLLNQLQKSANIIGSEKNTLTVKWSSGENENDVENNVIYLSPNDATDAKKIEEVKEISEEASDGLTGKVYLASTLKETVDPRVYKAAQRARKKAPKNAVERSTVKLWEAMETSIARHKILEDWIGFAPYLSKDAENSSDTKSQVQNYLDASAEKPTIDAAATGIAWNLLNPKDTVRIPDCYDKCIDFAAEALADEVEPGKRMLVSRRIAKRIATILGVTEEQEEDQKTTLCDGSLLGKKVENELKSDLSNQIGKSASDKEDNDNHKLEILSVEDEHNSYKREHKHFIAKLSDSDKAKFKELRRKLNFAIQTVEKSLLFRNSEVSMHDYALRSGEIDENALFKLKLKDDRVMMRKETINKKDIAITLLVDESGSMGGYSNKDRSVTRAHAARNVALVFAEGLRNINGVKISVYGHTADQACNGCSIFEYFSPRTANIATMMQMHGRANNQDGYAMQEVINKIRVDYSDAKENILFVISDGQPSGNGYSGRHAYDHMNKVCKEAKRRFNIDVYGIGIDNAFDQTLGNKMYGEKRSVVISDIQSSLPIMTRFVRQIALRKNA